MSPVADEPTVEQSPPVERIGPYRLHRRLGQGGMGVVYLASGADDREVAVKVLRPHVAHDPTARSRLEREVRTLERVAHPGVAGIVDHDLDGERPYLVTAYVPGRPLDDLVEERGPLTPGRWLHVARDLAEALRAIHRAGVVHRDLKPGNVLMVDGRPVLIDFGIAQAADDLRLTATGLVIGTPGYLAPELADGEPVTESADWWGWAATMTFALTGRRPFGRGPFEAVLHRVHRGDADLAGIDPRLEPLLRAALSPKLWDRPGADEILAGLDRYAAGRPALDRPAPAVRPAPLPTLVQTRVLPEGERPPEVTPEMVARLVPPLLPARRTPDPAALPAAAVQPANPPAALPRASAPPGSVLRSPRSGTLFAVWAALVGLAARYPLLAGLTAAVLMTVARAVDRTSTTVMRRRQVRGGPGRSDGLVATMASPLHLATSALVTLPSLILPLLSAVTVGALAALGLGVAQGFGWGPLAALSVAAGAGTGLVSAWWGPGGSSLRRGARTAARALRPAWLNGAVAAVLLGLAVVLLLPATAGAGPDWSPLSNPIDDTELPEQRDFTDLLPDLPEIPDIPGMPEFPDFPDVDLPFLNE